MRQNIRPRGTSSEKTVKDIRRATRKQYSAEEKIRIVLDGLSHLVCYIKRRVCDDASAWFQLSFV